MSKKIAAKYVRGIWMGIFQIPVPSFATIKLNKMFNIPDIISIAYNLMWLENNSCVNSVLLCRQICNVNFSAMTLLSKNLGFQLLQFVQQYLKTVLRRVRLEIVRPRRTRGFILFLTKNCDSSKTYIAWVDSVTCCELRCKWYYYDWIYSNYFWSTFTIRDRIYANYFWSTFTLRQMRAIGHTLEALHTCNPFIPTFST